MRELVAKQGVPIEIGTEGEKLVQKVIFANVVSKYQELYGTGGFTIAIMRPQDTTAYTITPTINGDNLEWSVSATDVDYDGWGKCVIVYANSGGTVLAKSNSYDIHIIDDEMRDASSTPPAVRESWWDEFLAKCTQIQGYATSASTSATSASTSATNASLSETSASASALAAQGYAADAENEVDKVEEMTVTATTLSAGSSATVTKSTISGHYNFEFGIPRGADGSAYTLPTASADTKGGIKIGANLTMDGDTLNADAQQYTLPTASASVKGGIKVGANLTMDGDTLNADAQQYTLPTASTSTLGGVKIDGTTITIQDGVISGASTYELPTASSSTKGGVKVGDGLAISNEVLSVDIDKSDIGLGNVDNTSDLNKPISSATQTALDGKVNTESGKGLSTNDYTTAEKTKLSGIEDGANNYSLPIANTSQLGGVKVDGDTITIDSNGVITASGGGGGGEPSAYLKSVSVSGNTATFTNKDSSTIVFTPTDTTYNAGTAIDITSNTISVDATEISYEDLADLPTIPTNTSDLTNDSGFITNSYHDSTKQNVLTAGSNITINNNTISATDTTYSAGNNVTITNGVISAPTNVSAFTNDVGYTTNTGTVTSVAVKMNDTTKGTVTGSGTIDLGTVITSIPTASQSELGCLKAYASGTTLYLSTT